MNNNDVSVPYPHLRLQQLQRILEISHEMAATVSLDALLAQIVEASVELTVCASAGILLFDEAADALIFTIASDSAGALPGITVPIGSSIAGHVFVSGNPLIVQDVQADPRYYAQVEAQVGVKAQSLLAVPLQYRGHRVGVLEVENKCAGQRFGQADIDVLLSLAAHATIAIENARLYQQLEQHRDHLQDLVDARTAQLEREIEAHEKLILDLESFSHTVAHDLKNPLHLMMSYSQMLPRLIEDENAELKQFVAVISQTGHRMGRIIDELLTLASVRQQDVASLPIDMAAVVVEVEGRLLGMIQKSQAVIAKPQTWPMALGYAPWVVEVWANYVSNAIKYGGTPPHILLGADVIPGDDAATSYVRFWIQDNGVGIAPQDQEQLFTQFTRFSETRARGDGLGLSIVRRIVEKLGGAVGVASVVGEGSCFFFTLPLLEEAHAVGDTRERVPLSVSVPPPNTTPSLDVLLRMLGDVAPDLVKTLYADAVTGDVAAIQSAVGQIASVAPVLGAQLRELADNFNYDRIIVLLERFAERET